MKQSMLFVPTLRNEPSDAEIISHKLLLRGGYIKQVAAGIYTYLPLGYKVLKKIESIVREELDSIGCSELHMPVLQPKTLWQESGRWDDYGKLLMRMTDRHDREFALGPTHEEVITQVVRDYANSYKKLPLALYQIQTKFRDEFRPRYGLMRGREFSMKDLYTFHTDQADLDKWYDDIAQAYFNIFDRCGIDTRSVASETGEIGGSEAHEFMVMNEVGEDTITYCDSCKYAANEEKSGLKEGDKCPECDGTIKTAKGIEVGNIFKLGTKYSENMGAKFTDVDGKLKPIIMGCYGIGVSRVLMAVIEQNFDEDGVIWPKELTPFDAHIIIANAKDEEQVNIAYKLYEDLKAQGLDILIDDRNERAGVKFKDADLIGVPKRIVVGKNINEGLVEYKERTGEKELIKVDEVLNKI